MSINRKLISKQTPQGQPGFLGRGHIARAVIDTDFKDSDPFILLMDDMLDKKDGEPVGGPHPHAGFETVTLLLEGEIGDEAHMMKPGDLQLMTAGSGIIHTETIDTKLKMRLLQLWLNLPKKDRWAQPRVQDITVDHVPTASGAGWQLKVYSGTLAGVTSPILNHASVIIADLDMQQGATTDLIIPASFSTFLYVLKGEVKIGEDETVLSQDQVGWLDRFAENVSSNLKLRAGEAGARFVIYAGQPQGDPIVSHGPFIADSKEDIQRLFRDYREGKMKHISTVPATQRHMW
ncbi:MAG: pirin family protein [Chitinophagaceae bacterium]|nr:MAG: pirin family protein [Chitinophagaceae bacterium]